MLRRSLFRLVDFTAVSMPALSPSMEKGRIVQWAKKVGDKLSEGDSWMSVETDKAVVDFINTTQEGYVAAIYEKDGTTVPVGQIIAVLVENKEDLAKIGEFKKPTAAAAEAAAPAPAPTPAPTPAAAAPSSAKRFGKSLDEAIEASGPSVIRIAHEMKDKKALEAITPTGKGGRFTKSDLAHLPQFEYTAPAVATTTTPAAAAPAATPAAPAKAKAAAAPRAVPVIKAVAVTDFKVDDTALIQRLAKAYAAAYPPQPKKQEAKVVAKK